MNVTNDTCAFLHAPFCCADMMDCVGPGPGQEAEPQSASAAEHPAEADRASMDLDQSTDGACAHAPGNDEIVGTLPPLTAVPSMPVAATSMLVLPESAPAPPGAAQAAFGAHVDLGPQIVAPGSDGAREGAASGYVCVDGDDSMHGSSEEEEDDDEVPWMTLGSAATQEVAQQVPLPCTTAVRPWPERTLFERSTENKTGMNALEEAVLWGLISYVRTICFPSPVVRNSCSCQMADAVCRAASAGQSGRIDVDQGRAVAAGARASWAYRPLIIVFITCYRGPV